MPAPAIRRITVAGRGACLVGTSWKQGAQMKRAVKEQGRSASLLRMESKDLVWGGSETGELRRPRTGTNWQSGCVGTYFRPPSLPSGLGGDKQKSSTDSFHTKDQRAKSRTKTALQARLSGRLVPSSATCRTKGRTWRRFPLSPQSPREPSSPRPYLSDPPYLEEWESGQARR